MTRPEMFPAFSSTADGGVSTEEDGLGRWWAIGLLLLGVLFNVWIATISARVNAGSDFAQFYAAGKLAGTGHLYDRDAITKIEAEYGAPKVATARLPVVAFAFKPLSALPFPIARKLWLIANILAGVLATILWPGLDRLTMLTTFAWSLPGCLGLFYGQDVLFFWFFFSASIYLLAQRRMYASGVAFALCICKFHLLIGLAIMLLARKEWRAIGSAALTTAVLLIASFAIEGRAWPRAYLAVIHSPSFSPGTNRMPDVYGLVAKFPYAIQLEILLCVGIALALWLVSKRMPLPVAGALAAAVGLLMAHHAYGYDCILLLPLCVMMLQNNRLPLWYRLTALFMLSPLFLFVLASDYSVIAQALAFGTAAIALLNVRRITPVDESPDGGLAINEQRALEP